MAATSHIVSMTMPTQSVLAGARRLLSKVETEGKDAPHIWRFVGAGEVLTAGGRICFAAADGLRQRVGDLLRHQRNPPLPRRFMTEAVARCRREEIPLGEALLATEQIRPDGLRAALMEQTTEAIARLGSARVEGTVVTPLAQVPHDGSFCFTPAEILAHLGARADMAAAVVAKKTLREMLADTGGWGAACLAADLAGERVPVAVERSVPVATMVEGLGWASEALTAARAAGVSFVREPSGGKARVAWTDRGLIFTGLVELATMESLDGRFGSAKNRPNTPSKSNAVASRPSIHA